MAFDRAKKPFHPMDTTVHFLIELLRVLPGGLQSMRCDTCCSG